MFDCSILIFSEKIMKLYKDISKIAMVASLVTAISGPTFAADTIKAGVLHSLSGTMAISETTLKDTMLMLIEDQNKKGGVLGRQ